MKRCLEPNCTVDTGHPSGYCGDHAAECQRGKRPSPEAGTAGVVDDQAEFHNGERYYTIGCFVHDRKTEPCPDGIIADCGFGPDDAATRRLAATIGRHLEALAAPSVPSAGVAWPELPKPYAWIDKKGKLQHGNDFPPMDGWEPIYWAADVKAFLAECRAAQAAPAAAPSVPSAGLSEGEREALEKCEGMDWRYLLGPDRAVFAQTAIAALRRLGATNAEAVHGRKVMGWCFKDMAGTAHTVSGSVLPSYAQSEIEPILAGECTCPSGNGSLRWPCPEHPPTGTRGVSEAAKRGVVTVPMGRCRYCGQEPSL